MTALSEYGRLEELLPRFLTEAIGALVDKHRTRESVDEHTAMAASSLRRLADAHWTLVTALTGQAEDPAERMPGQEELPGVHKSFFQHVLSVLTRREDTEHIVELQRQLAASYERAADAEGKLARELAAQGRSSDPGPTEVLNALVEVRDTLVQLGASAQTSSELVARALDAGLNRVPTTVLDPKLLAVVEGIARAVNFDAVLRGNINDGDIRQEALEVLRAKLEEANAEIRKLKSDKGAADGKS